MRTWTFVALAALSLAVSPTRSSAQAAEEPAGVQAVPEQPSGQSQERARALFQAGVAAIEEGDYEGAYRYFRESFELSGRPQLLFNLGNAAERLRRDDEAIDWYRRYLDAMPDADNRAYVEGRLRALEQAQGSGEPDEPPADDGNEDGPTPAAAPTSDGGVVAGWVSV